MKRVNETEEKVSETIKGLDHMISKGFFRHYVQMGVPSREDIKNLNTKIGVVLKELGFNHSCERCGEVFKTERQLKSHKKIHEEPTQEMLLPTFQYEKLAPKCMYSWRH